MLKKAKYNLDYATCLSSSITFGVVALIKKTGLNYMPNNAQIDFFYFLNIQIQSHTQTTFVS